MKKLMIIVAGLFFIACSNKTQPTEKAVADFSGEHCFLITDGLHHEDSTSMHLIIKDSLVSGELNYIPYEKDAAIGTIKGIIKDSIIECEYSYQQEGMEFTEKQIWKMGINSIIQKTAPASYDENGNVTYDSTQFEFNVVLNKVNCPAAVK